SPTIIADQHELRPRSRRVSAAVTACPALPAGSCPHSQTTPFAPKRKAAAQSLTMGGRFPAGSAGQFVVSRFAPDDHRDHAQEGKATHERGHVVKAAV